MKQEPENSGVELETLKEEVPTLRNNYQMKRFLILLGVAIAAVFGYIVEPDLRLSARSHTDAPVIDPAKLEPWQLPEKVTLKTELKSSDKASAITITLAPGSSVKLLRVNGGNAVIRPDNTPYSIVLPISQTDLMEQLAAHPPTGPMQVSAITQAEEPKQAEPTQRAVEPMPAPAPAPTPAQTVEPAPVPVPEPAPKPADVAPIDVVQVMKDHISTGQIKEFSIEQVVEWQPEADETLNGVVYKTGSVSFKVTTYLGPKTIQAKAYIKDGKVCRWVGYKSGLEIK